MAGGADLGARADRAGGRSGALPCASRLPFDLMSPLRAAEFFAGIGLMRLGLESGDVKTVWANDVVTSEICTSLRRRGSSCSATFATSMGIPCGCRQPPQPRSPAPISPWLGIVAASARRARLVTWRSRSSMFWEFARVLEDLGDRCPSVVLLENVLGFASSHGRARSALCGVRS